MVSHDDGAHRQHRAEREPEEPNVQVELPPLLRAGQKYYREGEHQEDGRDEERGAQPVPEHREKEPSR